MAIVVNPSKTSTLRSRTAQVAVLHHVAGGKLVEVTRGKMGARIGSNKDEEGEKNRQGPRLSIRIVIGILPSDTETSAVSPCERVRKM